MLFLFYSILHPLRLKNLVFNINPAQNIDSNIFERFMERGLFANDESALKQYKV